MKVGTGAVWGVITGSIVGVAAAVISYLAVVAAADWLRELVYKMEIARGADPEAARQFAEIAVASAIVAAPIGAFFFTVALYLIIGIVMALLWRRVRPWWALGLLFGVILLAIDVVPDLLINGGPRPPAVPHLTYMSLLLNFAGPLLLAWFLNRKASRP
ncbi:MAG: hypothetical protein ACK4SY_09315 [Pyrobaculum sp.]